MRIKVELHKTAERFVWRECNAEVRETFFAELDRVRDEPIKNSTVIVVPERSRYVLRAFLFAGCIAIFRYDIAKGRIRVIECRKQGRKKNRSETGGQTP